MVLVGSNTVYLTADVKAAEVASAKRQPVNLAVVIDRSGSMSGAKLHQAKKAARQLVSQLTPNDRLAIVHYGSDVKSLNGLLVSDENRARLLTYIDGIIDEGGTNIGAGLTAGRQVLNSAEDGTAASTNPFRVNRLILISDGQPTEGITDHSALVDLVRELRRSNVTVSSIGVGDDFNEALMESFAEVGAGAYAYLQDASQLERIFTKDLNAAGTQVAQGVTLTLTVPAGTFVRALGYTPISRSRTGEHELITLALPDFAAGSTERVVVELSVHGAQRGQVIDVSHAALNYTDVLASHPVTTTVLVQATVTTDENAFRANQDGEALVFAARAVSGANTRDAVDALKRGDRDRARQYFEANKKMLTSFGSVRGAPSVSKDLSDQDDLIRGMEQAQDVQGVSGFSKEAHKKSRLNFGLFGSTY
jgi:Ca-activated chloride channel family protein